MGKLTDLQKIEIVSKYNAGDTAAKLGREYGVRGDSILDMLRRRNVQIKSLSQVRRKYTLNENFFDEINTEEKAYFLGLLYADGYNNQTRGEIHLSLQAEDKAILEKLQLVVGSNRPLLFLNLSQRYNKTQKDVYRFDISSKHMSQKLAQFGCIQGKSLTLKFPTKIPNFLVRHFIRGYFDGDGCFVSTRVKKGYIQFSISIVSTENFCKKLQDIVRDNLKISSFLSIRHKTRQNTTRSFNISGNLQVMKFMDWLYQDTQLYLKRKFDKYQTSKH